MFYGFKTYKYHKNYQFNVNKAVIYYPIKINTQKQCKNIWVWPDFNKCNVFVKLHNAGCFNIYLDSSALYDLIWSFILSSLE